MVRKQDHHSRGATVLELLLFVGLVFIVVFAFQMVVSSKDSAVRDLERLITIRKAEVAFARLYLATGSYASAAASGGCVKDATLASCDFQRVGISGGDWRDPGKENFRILEQPTDKTFSVAFSLERSHGGLAAGSHILTPEGIR